MQAAQAASLLLASKTIRGRETGEGWLTTEDFEALRELGGRLIDNRNGGLWPKAIAAIENLPEAKELVAELKTRSDAHRLFIKTEKEIKTALETGQLENPELLKYCDHRKRRLTPLGLRIFGTDVASLIPDKPPELDVSVEEMIEALKILRAGSLSSRKKGTTPETVESGERLTTRDYYKAKGKGAHLIDYKNGGILPEAIEKLKTLKGGNALMLRLRELAADHKAYTIARNQLRAAMEAREAPARELTQYYDATTNGLSNLGQKIFGGDIAISGRDVIEEDNNLAKEGLPASDKTRQKKIKRSRIGTYLLAAICSTVIPTALFMVKDPARETYTGLVSKPIREYMESVWYPPKAVPAPEDKQEKQVKQTQEEKLPAVIGTTDRISAETIVDQVPSELADANPNKLQRGLPTNGRTGPVKPQKKKEKLEPTMGF